MIRPPISALMMIILGVPAKAQDATAEAVGGAIGGVVGLLIGLAIVLVIGAVVGWIASLIVNGTGSGLRLDIVIGVFGAFLAGWLFPAIGLAPPGGALGAFIAAVLGAVILLLLVKFIRRT